MSTSLPLSSLLVARLGGTPSAAMEDTLVALFGNGQQAWPGVPLEAEVFVACLAEALCQGAVAAGDWRLALDQVRAGDLYVACACAHRVPQALSAFESAYLSRMLAMVGHVDRSSAFADEIRQALRIKLFFGRDGERPLISEYSGRGSLQSFVRIVAVRTALRLRRRRVADGESADMTELPAPALSPELAYAKGRYQTEFSEALKEALAGLSSQQRNLLRLQVVAGLSGKQIAALYQVSQPTMSRWLAMARDAVLAETERLLQERLGISSKEFRSLARVVHSTLQLSLGRLLPEDEEE